MTMANPKCLERFGKNGPVSEGAGPFRLYGRKVCIFDQLSIACCQVVAQSGVASEAVAARVRQIQAVLSRTTE